LLNTGTPLARAGRLPGDLLPRYFPDFVAHSMPAKCHGNRPRIQTQLPQEMHISLLRYLFLSHASWLGGFPRYGELPPPHEHIPRAPVFGEPRIGTRIAQVQFPTESKGNCPPHAPHRLPSLRTKRLKGRCRCRSTKHRTALTPPPPPPSQLQPPY
jgi:hypothetical protein